MSFICNMPLVYNICILIQKIKNQRRPTLPGRFQPSTIGAEGLNFCVRYGNRCDPFAIVTGYVYPKCLYTQNYTVNIFGQVLDLLVSLS